MTTTHDSHAGRRREPLVRRPSVEDLRRLADLIKRGKHTTAVESVEASQFPVGLIDNHGLGQILVNAGQQAIWQFLPDGSVQPGDRRRVPNIGIKFFIFEDKPAHQQFAGMRALRRIMVLWGLIPPKRHEQVKDLWNSPDILATRKSAPVNGPFAAINKNLQNYPIARDSRERSWRWIRHQRSGRWWSKSTDADPVKYILARDAPSAMRHCPTAFDVNVLFLLLAEAQKRKCDRMEFKSRKAMLQTLGYSTSGQRNTARLDHSLRYWCEMSLWFSEWWDAKRKGKGNKRDVKELPPPIIRFDYDHARVTVDLDKAWREQNKSYYEKVPLPLPHDAVAQNLVLLRMATVSLYEEGSVSSRRRLCRKLGVNHKTRNRVLDNAMRTAATWFHKHGGSLDYRYDGTVDYKVTPPIRKPDAIISTLRETREEQQVAVNNARAERKQKQAARIDRQADLAQRRRPGLREIMRDMAPEEHRYDADDIEPVPPTYFNDDGRC